MLQLARKLAENNIQPIVMVPSRMVKTHEVREVGLDQEWQAFQLQGEEAQHSRGITGVESCFHLPE